MRTAMTPIVDYLRLHGSCATDDIFDGVTYWTDDQLQDIADENSTYEGALVFQASSDGLTYRVDCPKHWYPDPDTTRLYNNDTEITVGWTYDYKRQLVVLDEAKDLTHIEGVFINTIQALYVVWRAKAAHRSRFVNMKAGTSTKMDMSQEYDHCESMAQHYKNKLARRFKR